MHLAASASDPPVGAAIVRRRLAVLAASTGLFTLVDTGFNVIGPLWATRDLGLDQAGWAFLRAAGESGAFLGSLGLGVLSERAGARRAGAWTLAGAGLCLAGLAAGAPAGWLLPVLGACLSGTYVNLNLLAQQADPVRPGRANAIYRAAAATAAIAAPLLATRLASATGSYVPVLAAGAWVLGCAAAVVGRHSAVPPGRPARPWAALWAGYRRCLTLRPLLLFIALTRGYGAAVAAVGTFAALRFTRQLGWSEPAFGLLASVVAVGTLVVVLAGGRLADRLRPATLLGLAWLGGSVAALALGLSDSRFVTIAAYALFLPLAALCSVPLSLWASRIADEAGPAGPSRATVFTVCKIVQTGVTMLVLALLGVLEPRVGMAGLIWGGGLLGLPCALLALRLGARDPGPPHPPVPAHGYSSNA